VRVVLGYRDHPEWDREKKEKQRRKEVVSRQD